MADRVPDNEDGLDPPQAPLQRRLLQGGSLVTAILAFAWAWHGADMRPMDLWTFRANMAEFLQEFLTPDFALWRLYLREMVVTLQIAMWGTRLAVLFAIPLGVLCAHNVAPAWIWFPMRRLMDACRSINEIVFAVLFVVAVGLGPFAGTLAIFVHTLGVLAKLFSEAVEAIDPRPVEGIRSMGGDPVHEVLYGVIPQVAPLWVSYGLYKFESKLRSATVVGLVGAGGIGQIFFDTFRAFDFAATSAIIIFIVVSVSLADIVPQQLRRLTI